MVEDAGGAVDAAPRIGPSSRSSPVPTRPAATGRSRPTRPSSPSASARRSSPSPRPAASSWRSTSPTRWRSRSFPASARRFVDAHRRLVDGLTGRPRLARPDRRQPRRSRSGDFLRPRLRELRLRPDRRPRQLAADRGQAPEDRGIVCGALDPRPAATRRRSCWSGPRTTRRRRPGRGLDRVGLANAPSLADASCRTSRSASCAGSPRRPPSRACRPADGAAPSIPRSFGGRRNRPGGPPRRPDAVAARRERRAGSLPARRSAAWSLVFRVGYRLSGSSTRCSARGSPTACRVSTGSWSWGPSAAGRAGRDRAADPDHRRRPRLPGPSERPVLVDEEHRGGRLGRGRSVRATGPRYAVVPLRPGPERDAVIRATWTQQPFPANLLYRAAARHVAAVGTYYRLDPIVADAPSTQRPAATRPTKEPHEQVLARLPVTVHRLRGIRMSEGYDVGPVRSTCSKGSALTRRPP